jgi:hypothetical protein
LGYTGSCGGTRASMKASEDSRGYRAASLALWSAKLFPCDTRVRPL